MTRRTEATTAVKFAEALLLAAGLAVAGAASASWYWPFGDDDEPEPPRLSEMVEKASELIDEATDLAADGKGEEAVAKYRAALAELERLEAEDPERAAKPEFASVRNKRAYVNAAIDSMLIGMARENAKAVAVTDTTDLERRYQEKKNGAVKEAEKSPERPATEIAPAKPAPKAVRKRSPRSLRKAPAKKSESERLAAALREDKQNRELRLAYIGALIGEGKFEAVKEEIDGILRLAPSDVSALNLLAAAQAAQGDFASAKKTLDTVIQSNPRDYHGYYNMAGLRLAEGAKDAARRYYETGRAYAAGPRDEALEKELE